MVETKYDLVGDLGQKDKTLAPEEILEQQALLLEEKTEGRIKVKIKVNNYQDEDSVVVNFFLIIPKMNDFIYGFLFIYRSFYTKYPAKILWNDEWYEAENESEFVAKIANIFADKKTRKMIADYNN